MANIWHDSLSNSRVLVPGVGSLSAFEPAGINQQIQQQSQYQQWRMWRYEHISLEFEMKTWAFARQQWELKRPWWLGPR